MAMIVYVVWRWVRGMDGTKIIEKVRQISATQNLVDYNRLINHALLGDVYRFFKLQGHTQDMVKVSLRTYVTEPACPYTTVEHLVHHHCEDIVFLTQTDGS